MSDDKMVSDERLAEHLSVSGWSAMRSLTADEVRSMATELIALRSHSRASGVRAEPWPIQPVVFLTAPGEGVLFDPQGKFHGWLMRQHPDGLWITVRKLEEVDPEDNPLARMLTGGTQP